MTTVGFIGAKMQCSSNSDSMINSKLATITNTLNSRLVNFLMRNLQILVVASLLALAKTLAYTDGGSETLLKGDHEGEVKKIFTSLAALFDGSCAFCASVVVVVCCSD